MTQTTDPTPLGMDEFSWNNLSPTDALAMCARARGLSGLAKSEADGGFFLAARYDDVVDVLGDTDTFSSWPTVFRPVAPGVPPFPALEYDAPRHAPWREVFRELTTPRAAKALQPQVLADITRHIDAFIESGSCDLIHDLAEYVPAETIFRAAGIEDESLWDEIRTAALAGVAATGTDPEEFVRAMGRFAALVQPLIDERQAAPREDYLSRLVAAQPEGEPISHQTIIGLVFGLLAAGHHSTTSAMGTLFAHVLSRPEVRQAVLDNPKIIPTVVEESLRLDSPFYGFYRRAVSPTEVSGTPIAAEDSVCVAYASANRDPARFKDPDTFRLDRGNSKHVAFGSGAHACAGAPLARLELQLALAEVLRRMPDIELTSGEPVKAFGGASATYVDALPARFTPGTPSSAG